MKKVLQGKIRTSGVRDQGVRVGVERQGRHNRQEIRSMRQQRNVSKGGDSPQTKPS